MSDGAAHGQMRINAQNVNWWHKRFTEAVKTELRDLTYELTKRIKLLLEKMLSVEPHQGWRSWLLGACRDAECSQSLGVPVYYTTEYLSRIIEAQGAGIPRSHCLAVEMRLDIALSLIRKVTYHPLCPRSIKRFADGLGQIERSKRDEAKPTAHNAKVSGLELWKELQDCCEDRAMGYVLKESERGKVRRYLRSFRKSNRDVEFYTLLLGISDARSRLGQDCDGADRSRLQEAIDELKAVLAHLALHTDCLQSDVVPWWAIAELLYNTEKAGAPSSWTDSESGFMDGLDRICDRALKTVFPSPEHLSDDSWYNDIEEYSEIGAMTELLVAAPALSVYAALGLGGRTEHDPAWFLKAEKPGDLLDRAKELIAGGLVAKKTGSQRDGKDLGQNWGRKRLGVPSIRQDDKGLLAAMATRLWSLLEFWRWQSLFEVVSAMTPCVRRIPGALPGKEKIRYVKARPRDGAGIRTGKSNQQLSAFAEASKKFARMANWHKHIWLSWPVWYALRKLPKPGEDACLSDPKCSLDGTRYSIMLLGAAGIGKTALVEKLWGSPPSAQAILVQRTPVEMGAHWLDVSELHEVRGAKELRGEAPSYVVVFVDEVHLPAEPSAFSLLLKPMQEGHPNLKLWHPPKPGDEENQWQGKNRALYVFASSAFWSEEEFGRASDSTGDMAMRDFATRVSHWVTLPELFTVPEHKFLVTYCFTAREIGGKAAKRDDAAKPEKPAMPDDCLNAEQRKRCCAVATRLTLDLDCDSLRELIRVLRQRMPDSVGGDPPQDMLPSGPLPAYPAWAVHACRVALESSTYRCSE